MITRAARAALRGDVERLPARHALRRAARVNAGTATWATWPAHQAATAAALTACAARHGLERAVLGANLGNGRWAALDEAVVYRAAGVVIAEGAAEVAAVADGAADRRLVAVAAGVAGVGAALHTDRAAVGDDE